VFEHVNLSIKKDGHLTSMIGQMYISSLIGRDEASNGGCLGRHMTALCVDVYIPKREGGIDHGALTLDTHLDPWVDG